MKKLNKKEVETLLQRIDGVNDTTPPQEIEEIIVSWFNQECDESWEVSKRKKEVNMLEEYGHVWPDNWKSDYSQIILFHYQNGVVDDAIDFESKLNDAVYSLCKCKNLTQKSIDILFVHALVKNRLDIVEYILLNHPCERMKAQMKYWNLESNKVYISGMALYHIGEDYNALQSDELPGCGLWCPRIEKVDYFHLMEVINNK